MPQVSKKSGMMNTMKTKPAKYALGTDAAVVEDPKKKPLVPVDNSTVSSSDPDSPKFIGPPTEAKMKLKTEDVALDKVATETKITSKANVPATTHSLAQIADMDKVKAHQEKLNKYGANLKVDGMWGAKTEKASRDLYPQYKEKPVASKTRQAPVSDSRMKGLFASSGKEDTTSTTAKTVSKATPKQVAKVDTTASNPAIPVTGSGSTITTKTKSKAVVENEKYVAKTQREVDAYSKKSADTLARRKVKVENNQASNDPNQHIAGSVEEGRVGAQLGHDIIGAAREHNLSVTEQENAKMNAANKGTSSSKSLDGGDAAIYAAEAVGPAIGRKMIKSKSAIMKGLGALAMVGPTIADIAKTNYDDDFKTPVKSTLKATARGVVLGTIGSTIAGAGRRSVKGLIAEGKEATAIKSMRKGASKALNKAEASRSFGSVKDQNASLKAIDAAKAELQVAKSMKLSKQKSFGQNLGKAFDNTIVGKGIKAVTNSKIVKAVKSRSAVNSLKESDKPKTGKPLKGKSLDIAEETRINKLKADKDAIKQTAEDARYNNAVHNRPSDSSAKIKTTSNSSTNQLDDILGKNSEARAAAAPARAQAKFAAKSGEIVYDEGASSPNPNYKSGKAIREVNALRKAKLEEISKPMRLLGMGEAKTTSTKVEPSGSMKLNSTAKENPVKGKSNNSAARRGTKSKR